MICNKCVNQYSDDPEAIKAVQENLKTQSVTTIHSMMSFATHQSLLPILRPEVCKKCNMTMDDCVAISRMGCPSCYESFRKHILHVLENYHNNIRHCGKRPKRYKEYHHNINEREKLLKLRLAKAIELEKFEEAKEIQEEINKLYL